MTSVSFEIIEHGSEEYKKAISLREEVLRKPLGQSFSFEELKLEKTHTHIVGYLEGKICGTAVLVSEGKACKMQRVAVKAEMQNKGVGSSMIKFCESYALSKGYTEIYCHARDTAVEFYLKNGYLLEGKPFSEDTIPHQKMRKIFNVKNSSYECPT